MLRRFVKVFFTIANRLLYRVEYIHPDKFPTAGPVIIASNHQHTFDVSVIHCKVKPWVYWVSKKELTDIPVLGRLIMKMGVMPVDRNRHDMSVARSMFENIKQDHVIGIFPQGTRIKNPDMIEKVIPKTGTVHFAIKAGIPIIPVGIKGTYKLFSKIQVHVGDPIDMKMLSDQFAGEDKVYQQTIYVMKTIYSLAGYDYQMTADVYKGRAPHDH
jgi:1-acyl-sn-glycerol-3-phosphate acyltransferase